MTEPLHHIHKRKRVHKELEQYPHPNRLKQVMDKLVYAVGILGPAFGTTQVYKIWTEQNASGISLAMFGPHMLFNLIWITYGILHKEKPIIMMYSLWFIINTLITVGAIIYG